MLGEAPKFVDAKPSIEQKELFYAAERVAFTENSLMKSLEAEREIDIRHSKGQACKDLMYSRRIDNGCEWLFLAHLTRRFENPDETEYPLNVTTKCPLA